ncbi:hypothetical protein J6590_086085 [Homalodisca vitripennis]|nr:hypothetical protein J6590_086085 [Homalodisca vitripennis]
MKCGLISVATVGVQDGAIDKQSCDCRKDLSGPQAKECPEHEEYFIMLKGHTDTHFCFLRTRNCILPLYTTSEL